MKQNIERVKVVKSTTKVQTNIHDANELDNIPTPRKLPRGTKIKIRNSGAK